MNHLHPVQSTVFYFCSCLRESFAPSTVCVLLLHVTTISTVHLLPACSLHGLLRLQHVHALYVPLYHSTCLRESFVPSTVYVLLLHALLRLATLLHFPLCYVTAPAYVLHSYCLPLSVPSSSSLQSSLHCQASTYVSIWPHLYSLSKYIIHSYGHGTSTPTPLCGPPLVFSCPSSALITRWQRMHGYTSLIRPRLHPSPSSAFSRTFSNASHLFR